MRARQILAGGDVVEDMEGVDQVATSAEQRRLADDRRQLAELFDGEFDAVYRFCLARTGDSSSADDAASEAFLAAARVFSDGRGDEVDRPWLFVVARNRIVDQWRSNERHRRRVLRLRHQRQKGEEAPDSIATSAVADQVVVALASLPERQRAALGLRYLDEHSVSEVAERLDVNYLAAESLLARGRRSFAAAWEHRND